MSSNGAIVSGDQKIGDSSYNLTVLPRDVLISKDKGYASKIYSIRLIVGDHQHHVIAKLPSDFHMKQSIEKLLNDKKISKEQFEAENQKNFEMISSIHNRELDFYKLAKGNFQGLHYPKFIFGEEMTKDQEGIILMEDFTDRCAKDISNFKGISKNQVIRKFLGIKFFRPSRLLKT